jgi:hypothetical protein
MAKKKKTRKVEKTDLERHEEYVEFLKKRVFSKNYKENVTKEEYQKTKAKYDKAKLKLKFMKSCVKN